ncbi:MAG: protein kinase [Acidobacteria bacterium]|nr:protein kinase [Acidobacteriota bacterium]
MKRRCARRPAALALLGLCLACVRLEAGERPEEAGLPLVRAYRARETLDPAFGKGPQNFAVHQDARGILYFGNNHGVLEFDGTRWRTTPTPARAVVLSFARDGDVLYTGAAGDLGRVETDPTGDTRFVSLKSALPAGGPPLGDFWSAVATSRGVFFRTPDRLFRKLGDAWTAFAPLGANGKLGMTGLVGDTLLQRDTEAGLLRLGREGLERVPFGERFAKDRAFLFLPFGDRSVLIGTRGSGLHVFHPEATTADTAFARLPTDADAYLVEKEIYGGAWLPDGTLAILTFRGGLVRFAVEGGRGRVLGVVGRPAGLPAEDALSILSSREAGVWLGLMDGIAHVEWPSPVSRFGEESGVTGFVESLARHEGSLYAATSRGPLRLIPRNGLENARFVPVPGAESQCFSIVSVPGTLLLSCRSGIFRLEKERFVPVVGEATAPLVRSSKDPSLVYAGLEPGLGKVRLTPGGPVWEGRVPGVDVNVTLIGEDPDGTLWLGLEDGLVRVLPSGTTSAFGEKNGLPAGVVRPLRLLGNRVFGATSGIYVFEEPGRFKLTRSPPAELSLGDPSLSRSVELSGGRDLVRFGNALLVATRGSQGDTYAAGAFSRLETSPRVLALLPEGDVVWVGTDEGLYRFDLTVAPPEGPGFPPLLRSVRAGPAAVPLGGAPSPFEWKQRSLRFEWALPAYDAPERNTFSPLLEGFDEAPPPFTTDTSRVVTNLPAGRYTLKLVARDVWGRERAARPFAFEIAPPLSRTLPAYAAYALLGALLLAGVFRLRTARLRERTRQLEAEVDERTQSLKLANEKLERTQRRVDELLREAPGLLEDLPSWAASVARELAAVIGVNEIQVFFIEAGAASLVSGSGTASLPADALAALTAHHAAAERHGELLLVPAKGLTGDLCGVLVVEAAGSLGPAELRLLSGFAHQLGGAVEMQRLRKRLATAGAASEGTRQELVAQGLSLLAVCPSCGRCFDASSFTRCTSDGAPLSSDAVVPYRFASRYRLERVLGQGGMGTVYSAFDERLSRTVAVKMVRSEALGTARSRIRFEIEVRLVAGIRHPGVVEVFDTGELPGGAAFLVMEKLAGRTLAAVLASAGPASFAQAATLLTEAASALSAAHARGVVHRDVKPENVFLVPRPSDSSGALRFSVKLLDFGLAKQVSEEASLTQTGHVVGTPQYMSPEQASAKALDVRSDLYSLAVVVWEALTGSPLVSGADLGAVFVTVLRTPAPPPSSLRPAISRKIDALLLSALAKDPAARPKDLAGWAAALAKELHALQITAPDSAHWPATALTPPAPVV